MASEKLKLLERAGAKLETPENGIVLWAKGDFNDVDYLEQSWNFDFEDIDLVMWLLKYYTELLDVKHWEESLTGWDLKLFSEFTPKVYDSCMSLNVHTIEEFHIYVYVDGICKELKYEDCDVLDSKTLCEKYIEDYDDEYDEEDYYDDDYGDEDYDD